jgi:hypothetical protein
MTEIESENTVETIPQPGLSLNQRDEMFQLLSQHFAGVTRNQFEQDLSEKNWVILLRHNFKLVGFSTLLIYETTYLHEPFSVVYSGDTIVSPEAWGAPTLSRAWIACVRNLREHYPRGRYYWLLLTSGFRTYRFLPLFWRQFYPRFDEPTPPATKRLMDHLAQERFSHQYNSTDGIVRFAQPQQLRPTLSPVPAGRTINPHVAFFLAQNPGHIAGDELVCLTELSDENLSLAGRRMIQPPS